MVNLKIILTFVNGPDNNIGKRPWSENAGKCHFTIAYVLILNIHGFYGDPSHVPLRSLLNPQDITSSVQGFTGWIIWGEKCEESSFLRRSTQLALILLRHGQYDAAEVNMCFVYSIKSLFEELYAGLCLKPRNTCSSEYIHVHKHHNTYLNACPIHVHCILHVFISC